MDKIRQGMDKTRRGQSGHWTERTAEMTTQHSTQQSFPNSIPGEMTQQPTFNTTKLPQLFVAFILAEQSRLRPIHSFLLRRPRRGLFPPSPTLLTHLPTNNFVHLISSSAMNKEAKGWTLVPWSDEIYKK
jgi:hypothetical protein